MVDRCTFISFWLKCTIYKLNDWLIMEIDVEISIKI